MPALPAAESFCGLLMLLTHTVFTRMPAAAYSLASALVRAMPAARDSEVGTEAPGAALPNGGW